MIQKAHFWVSPERNGKQGLEEMFAHPSSAAFLSTVIRKQSKSPLTDEWAKRMHTAEQYSALQRREILTPATTQTNLEGILLSEMSLYEVPRAVRFRGRKQNGGHQGLGGGRKGVIVQRGHSFSFPGRKSSRDGQW